MDVPLDVPRKESVRRVEVLGDASGRRQRSEAEKARIAAESLLPGVVVTDIARKHGITRWQVYDWRRRLKEGRLALPESIAEAPAFAALMIEGPPEPKRAQTTIEIVLGDVVIRAEPGVDGEHLVRVIRAVRAAA
jgi:transposase